MNREAEINMGLNKIIWIMKPFFVVVVVVVSQKSARPFMQTDSLNQAPVI